LEEPAKVSIGRLPARIAVARSGQQASLACRWCPFI